MVFLLALEFWLSSQSRLPRVIPSFVPQGDKFLHAGYFALTALFAARALRQFEGWGRGATAVALLVGCLLWGASDELHQSFVPGRDVEAADVAADVVGGGLAALAAVRLFTDRPRG